MKTEVPEHEHIYEDRWYPENRTTLRRVCCYPGCTETERRQPK